MRLLSTLAIALLTAGCAGTPSEDRPAVPTDPGPAPACAALEDIARGGLAVVLASVTWGLGPGGAIASAWANGTVDVLRDGSPLAEVALDASGCGTYQPPTLGTFVFRAKPTDGSCSLAGNATIVQTPDAGHVVRLALDFPCA